MFLCIGEEFRFLSSIYDLTLQTHIARAKRIAFITTSILSDPHRLAIRVAIGHDVLRLLMSDGHAALIATDQLTIVSWSLRLLNRLTINLNSRQLGHVWLVCTLGFFFID